MNWILICYLPVSFLNTSFFLFWLLIGDTPGLPNFYDKPALIYDLFYIPIYREGLFENLILFIGCLLYILGILSGIFCVGAGNLSVLRNPKVGDFIIPEYAADGFYIYPYKHSI